MNLKSLLNFHLCVCAAIILAGCATQHVDWNTRIGTFTFDQAVTELGPPDKQAKLSSGQTVADNFSPLGVGLILLLIVLLIVSPTARFIFFQIVLNILANSGSSSSRGGSGGGGFSGGGGSSGGGGASGSW